MNSSEYFKHAYRQYNRHDTEVIKSRDRLYEWTLRSTLKIGLNVVLGYIVSRYPYKKYTKHIAIIIAYILTLPNGL